MGVRVTSLRTELSQGVASPIGPCIVSESIRNASRGPWLNPRSYKIVATTYVRVGFCLDYSAL
jgi:hypothetical protein